MQCIAKLADIESPSYIVTCSGTREHAFVVSVKNKKFWKKSWLNEHAEDDNDKMDHVNSQLPDCPELTHCFTGKYNKKLSEYYLGSEIIGFEDQVILGIPDAIFLQRMSARTKTFDMVFFYKNKPTVFSVVDKSDLDTIRDWYPHKIYSCGADPLPLKDMEKWMEDKGDTMYEEMYEHLFNQEQSSASEYEPESDPESEDESCDESEEDSEVYEEEYEESDSDGDYNPEDLEPPSKKIKV